MEDNFSPKNISRRTKAKTPKFFKKVQVVCGILAAIGGIMLTPVTAGVSLPIAYTVAASMLAGAGTLGGAIGRLTVEDPSTTNTEDAAE
jgi:hypothetical protein